MIILLLNWHTLNIKLLSPLLVIGMVPFESLPRSWTLWTKTTPVHGKREQMNSFCVICLENVIYICGVYRGRNPAWHWSDWASNSECGCAGRRQQHVKYCTSSSSHPASGTVWGRQQRRPAVRWPCQRCGRQTSQQYVHSILHGAALLFVKIWKCVKTNVVHYNFLQRNTTCNACVIIILSVCSSFSFVKSTE